MGRNIRVAPSVLSANFLELGRELDTIATADCIHYDVMDGHFVPNLSFGPAILAQVKSATELPVDVHLMVSNPDAVVDAYLDAGADFVGFHLEATAHANRLVNHIHERGAKATVSICPATPVSALEELIELVDMVLVMSVNPGFGGQRFIEGTYVKLRRLTALMAEHKVSPLVEVDGGISAANAAEVCAAGANVLVAGSAIFEASDRAGAIDEIRRCGRAGQMRSV